MRELRDIVLTDFNRRREHNPAYSLRGLARDLGVSPASLSQLLSSKRKLSRKNVLKVAQKLSLSPAEIRGALMGGAGIADEDFVLLEEDSFRLMSEWFHFAILSLAEIKSSRADAKWIAGRLGITALEAHEATTRLVRLGLLGIKGARMRRLTPGVRTSSDVPSTALRKYHKQNLRLAETSIDRDAVESRDVTSITVAADPARLKSAKLMIKDFRRALAKHLEGGRQKEVYTLAIQLFPNTRVVTQGENEK